MKHFERPLAWLAAFLSVVASASAIFIASDPSLTWDLSPSGFRYALEQFAFPLATYAGAIAIATVYIAVGALFQSMRQNAATAWEITQSNFLSYAGTARALPMSALSGDPVSDNLTSRFGSNEMLEVEYLSPLTTVRRLYDTRKMSSDIEPVLNPAVVSHISQMEAYYEEFRTRLSRGEVTWLASFVDLAIATRQLRLHLAVTTQRMRGWSYVPVLELNTELGSKRRLPPFSSGHIPAIASDIRSELLCIVDVMHFSQRLEPAATRMLKSAFEVGALWDGADDRLKAVFLANDLHALWNETHQIIGARVSLQ